MSNKYNVIHPIFNDYSANMVKTVFHQLGFLSQKNANTSYRQWRFPRVNNTSFFRMNQAPPPTLLITSLYVLTMVASAL